MAKNKEKIKQILLITFVGLCGVMMILTIVFSIRENYYSDQGDPDRGIILRLERNEVGTPTATPTMDPEATPIPTKADWERQG